MLRVFFAQDCLFRGDSPVDAEALVCYGDTVVCFRMVELIALILEDGSLAQYGETVSEAFRNEELTMIFFCEFDGDVLSVGGRPFSDIDGHIQDGSSHTPDKLALCIRWALEVQSAHHPIGGHAFVILHKVDGADFLLELSLRERFEEVPASIPEDAWFYDE